ncbi:DUF4157 domain-containing protein [Flavobacteriaceae bacterium]|nr:DUF4157 domain-containing protein [Flavobacteriaceae bacterium]
MSASVSLFKKDMSKKASQDSPSKSNSENYGENSSTIQLQSFQDKADELVGGENSSTIQLQSFQDKADELVGEESQNNTTQLKEKTNNTGLPDQLKAGVEQLSGHSLDDVKVHYNSSKPAQLKAHAYAEGNQIHLAQGQEKHLGHEAWHVVQQKENRVNPTKQINGVGVNDNPSLEKEADTMGAKATSADAVSKKSVQLKVDPTPGKGVIQGFFGFGGEKKDEAAPSEETETPQKEGKEEEQKTFLDQARQTLSSVWDGLQSLGSSLLKKLSAGAEMLKNGISEMSETAAETIGGVAEKTYAGVKLIEDYAGQIAEKLGTKIQEADDERAEKEKEYAEKYPVRSLMKAVVYDVFKGIVNLVPFIGPLYKMIPQARNAVRRFSQWHIFSDTLEKLKSSTGALKDGVATAAGKAWKGFSSACIDLGQTSISLLSDIAALFSAGAGKAIGVFSDIVKFGRKLYKAGRGIWKTISLSLHKDRDNAVDAIVNAANKGDENAIELLAKIAPKGKEQKGWTTHNTKNDALFKSMNTKSGGPSGSNSGLFMGLLSGSIDAADATGQDVDKAADNSEEIQVLVKADEVYSKFKEQIEEEVNDQFK